MYDIDKLFEYQEVLLRETDDRFFRDMYTRIDWQQRMFGITGFRGTGKTTILLQYLKYGIKGEQEALYVSADDVWFYENRLVDLADRFVKYGGKVLLIDEIHKYANWSRELKNMYDRYPDLRIIFTASSALDIHRGEADLSRRALTYELPGLSFREYLEFVHNISLPGFSLPDLLSQARDASGTILNEIKPLPLFKQYLRTGYFPFSPGESDTTYFLKLNRVINTVMETDLYFAQEHSPANIAKMKSLLGVIAESAPFEPNISKIASKLALGRDTVKSYLQHLEKARLLNLLSKDKKGIAGLQKPDKIYPENPNFSYALRDNPVIGTIREIFFVNQLRNAGYEVRLGDKADFIAEGKWTFEVGGPSKGTKQLTDSLQDGYIARDETEHAFANSIPLWLFGFLVK